MLYGDIEGQGKVYDDEGTLIPLKEECVMSTFNAYCRKGEKQIRLKWRIMFYDGLGTFVFTDKRLVFLRNPIKYDRSFKFSGDRFATLADWEYWTNRSNRALDAGAKEFFEISYSEIEKVKTGSDISRIFVKTEDERFRFTVEAKVGAELEKLQTQEGKLQPIICFEELKADDEKDNEEDNSK
ncbi:hypothetical protein [[Eubacterium] cellulosolvens]